MLGGRVGAVEAALGDLRGVLSEIQGRLQALDQLGAELVRVREVALEASARAQDALTTSALVGGYDARLNQLTLAVAEGIQHVERAENRIRATVQRARKELVENGFEPSPGLEAEASSLRLGDVDRGPERPVHPVREEVGDDDEIIPLPGVPGHVSRGFLKALGA